MHIPPTNNPFDLRDHMLTTYKVLRRMLFGVGFMLPIVLWAGGHLYQVKLQDSMSQYYHADENYSPDKFSREDQDLIKKAMEAKSEQYLAADQLAKSKQLLRPGAGRMRDWFVGSLFVIGALLIVYRGYTRKENWLLNIAGGCAICVALFPMPWGVGMGRSWVDREVVAWLFKFIPWIDVPSFHYISAVGLFMCLAGVCWTSANVTLKYGRQTGALDEKQITRYRAGYLICGLTMGAMPIGALLFPHIPTLENYTVFIIEWIGVWAFAFYWIIKSFEIDALNRGAKTVAEKAGIVNKTNVLA